MMYFKLVVCLLFIERSESANILAVFSTPFLSHHIAFRPLVNALAKRGHQMTVITTDPEYPSGKTPQNIMEIDLHDVSYKVWNKLIGNENHNRSIVKDLNILFEEQIKSIEMQELINDKKKTFNLIIVESLVRLAKVFSYLYKSPIIEISSLGPIHETLDLTGAANNPLIYPLSVRRRINDLTIWEKISEMYRYYNGERVYAELEKMDNELLKRVFGRHVPDARELKYNVDMIFLSVHPLWDFNRPVPSKVVYLGGLQLHQPTKDLPKDLKTFLDSSKKGVIYMSLGTTIKSSKLPREKIQVIVNTFSQLPFNILWKWDNSTSFRQVKNIRTFKWCPQADLLKHPNIKLFITQGGLQSTDDAIEAGVPLIGIPMRADQWYNTEMYTIHNIGMKLDINSITEDILRNAIETVMENSNYRKNVINLRKIMHEQPQTSVERAVWWIEHVLRHGNAEHLRTPAAHMHWTEYYALDLVVTLICAVIIIFTLILNIIYFIASYSYYNIVNKLVVKCIKTKNE